LILAFCFLEGEQRCSNLVGEQCSLEGEQQITLISLEGEHQARWLALLSPESSPRPLAARSLAAPLAARDLAARSPCPLAARARWPGTFAAPDCRHSIPTGARSLAPCTRRLAAHFHRARQPALGPDGGCSDGHGS